MAATPKNQQRITYLKPREAEALDTYADQLEISKAEAIRGFVLDGLDLRTVTPIGAPHV